MTIEQAHDRFVEQCDRLLADIERDMADGAIQATHLDVARILVKNVAGWRDLARERRLYHPMRPNFGASQADLDFGGFADRVFDLEAFYRKRIYLPMGADTA